jgi:ABC-type transporter Mla MlaB component
MKEQGVDAGEMVTLQWSGDLTIRRIAKLKGQVQQALVRARHVSIAIAADAECDMSLMQLLCAAHRTASREGKTLQFGDDVSPQFKKIMKLAGFSRHIGCARDESGCCLWKLVRAQLDGKAPN